MATIGTAKYLEKNLIKATRVKKAYEGRPNILDLLSDNKVDIVFNTTEGFQSIKDSRDIRTLSLAKKLPYFTSATGAWAAAQAMKSDNKLENNIISLQELRNYKSTNA